MLNQILQVGLQSGLVTLLDDDDGIAYCNSLAAEATEKVTPHLYSVNSDTGAVFEVNCDEVTHPYDEFTLQATLDADYSVTATSIRHKTKAAFTAEMLGDTVRFISSDAEVHDQVRVITSASAQQIGFASVAGLGTGDVFIIAGTRFRVRFAPFQGKSKTTIKTVDGVFLRVRPGDRSSSLNYLVVRLYENFSSTIASEGTVRVFEGDETSLMTRDRVVSIQAQGEAIELEIESLGSHKDFKIELIEVDVREEPDQNLDMS